jgi:hypothetical protein
VTYLLAPFSLPSWQWTEEVVDRLQNGVGKERLFLTAEDGTIELITDGESLWAGTRK